MAHNLAEARALPSRRRNTGLRGWFGRNRISIITAVALLFAWEIGARLADFPYFPPVQDILVSLYRLTLDGTIAKAVGATLLALIIGLCCAILSGTILGTAMGLSPTIRYAFGPYVDALMAAPMTAFVPLFILLFGLGIETRIVVVTLFAFFPITVNTQAGMMAANPDLIEMARSFSASRWQIFFKVRLPMSYRHIQAGLRMGMARGVDGNITGEVLIAAVGLGGLVALYGRAFSTDRLFAVVIVIVAMSFAAVTLTNLATRFLLGVQR